MKRIKQKKSWLCLCFIAVIAMVFTACGGATQSGSGEKKGTGRQQEQSRKMSRTEAAFDGLNEKNGIHMNVDLTVGKTAATLDISAKGEKLRVEGTYHDQKVVMIDDDKYCYVLIPATKTGSRSEDDTTGLEDAVDTFVDIPDLLKDAGYTTGTRTIRGTRYETEVYREKKDDDQEQVVFAFDGDSLKYIIAEEDQQSVVLKVNALNGTIKKNAFRVPSGYKVTTTQDDED